jgi:hypothetical protein
MTANLNPQSAPVSVELEPPSEKLPRPRKPPAPACSMPPARTDPEPPPIHRLLELIKSDPDPAAALAHLELLVSTRPAFPPPQPLLFHLLRRLATPFPPSSRDSSVSSRACATDRSSPSPRRSSSSRPSLARSCPTPRSPHSGSSLPSSAATLASAPTTLSAFSRRARRIPVHRSGRVLRLIFPRPLTSRPTISSCVPFAPAGTSIVQWRSSAPFIAVV